MSGFRVLPGLRLNTLMTEIVAGITLLAIAVPLNIGYAQIAGLPATAGLYSLILPGVFFALLASTRQLVASPDAAAAALVASSLTGLAATGHTYVVMAMAQALVGGVMFFACAFFRLGFLANFLSEPILIGFVGGLALDILISQIAKMLGVKIDSGAEFIGKVEQLFTGLAKTNPWSVLISVLAVAVLVGGRRLAARFPWALVVLILSTVAVVVFHLEDKHVSVLGKVPAGPPSLEWPMLSWSQWFNLIPGAAALTLVAMAEGLLVARNYGQKRGYATNPNRDLFAFGAANIASGVTGGFTVGSSTSRTAAVDQAGSRTQVPTLVTAVGTLLLVLFGTALLEHIPSPGIGAIVGVAVVPLLGVRKFRELWSQRRFEFGIGAVCFIATLLLGPIIGILIAFVLSLLNLATRASHPPIDLLSANDTPSGSLLPATPGAFLTAPGLIVVRFAAPLFFANATEFDDSLRKAVTAGKPLGLTDMVLDCGAMTDIDVTGAKSFADFRTWVAEQGVAFHLSRVRPDFLDKLADFDLDDGSRIFDSNRQALDTLNHAQEGASHD